MFSEPQPELRRLVDLIGLGWPALRHDAFGLEIAATCRIAELHGFEAPADWSALTLVAPCCDALLGSFKIWNVATVGGNICLALPAGPMTALAVALDGTATIWIPDGRDRQQKIIDLVLGDRLTTLEAGEILRCIRLPAAHLRRRVAFRQISLSPLGRSTALLIGTIGNDGDFELTITASTARPVRLDFAAHPTAHDLSAAIDTHVTAWFDDVHGAPDWRRLMTLRLAEEIRRELAGASCA